MREYFWNVFHKNFSHLREEMGRFRKRNEPKYKLLYILLVTNIVMSPTALTPRLASFGHSLISSVSNTPPGVKKMPCWVTLIIFVAVNSLHVWCFEKLYIINYIFDPEVLIVEFDPLILDLLQVTY